MKNSTTLKKELQVVEIFHSVQGEGRNMGRSAVFVRLAHCNKNCWFCDTDWNVGVNMTVGEVYAEVEKLSSPQDYPNNLLVWTGGEPTLQLSSEILEVFDQYYNCIETNGTHPVPAGIDYITCSPKVDAATLHKNFTFVNEFRFPMGVGIQVPSITELPPADNYYVSPLFVGDAKKRFEADAANIDYCIDFVKKQPQWKLSVQVHKFLNVR